MTGKRPLLPKKVFHVHGGLTNMSSIGCQKKRVTGPSLESRARWEAQLSKSGNLAAFTLKHRGYFFMHFKLTFITSRLPSSLTGSYLWDRYQIVCLLVRYRPPHCMHISWRKRQPLFIKFKKHSHFMLIVWSFA